MQRKILFFIVLLVALISCKQQYKNDPYRSMKPLSVLSRDVLEASEQIIFYKDDVILLKNFSENSEYYDPHLLFYDKLKLRGVCYFSSEKVEDIYNDTIIGYFNAARAKRSNWYRNDMPSKYVMGLLLRKGGEGLRIDKTVDSIFIDTKTFKVFFFIRRSNDRYAGLHWSVNNFGTKYNKKFSAKDTLVIELSKLRFDRTKNEIATSYIDEYNNLVSDIMIVPDSSILDSFYLTLYKTLIKR